MKENKQLNNKKLEKVTGGLQYVFNYKGLLEEVYHLIADEDINKAIKILNKYKNSTSMFDEEECREELSKLKQRKDCPGQGGASSVW